MSDIEPSPAESAQPKSSLESEHPVEQIGDVKTDAVSAAGIPDATMLEDRVPEWAQLSRKTVLWTVLLGIVWMVLSYHPLWHTDVWGHLSYGREIVSQQQIPETEPLLPLSQGVPMVDTAWLAQVAGYGMYSQWGTTSLQFLYAGSLFICVLALLFRFRENTDSIGVSLIGLAVFGFVAYKSLLIMRPQVAGLACFVVMFSLVTRRKWHRCFWIVVPVLFALWANLHGSFLLGFLVLGALGFGRASDVYLRTKSIKAVAADTKTRQLFVMGELAVLATLFNPYGLGIYPAIHMISQNPNMASLIEWDPITLRMMHGKAMAVAAIVLIIIYRLTPRRVSCAEPILLIGLGLSALWAVRMTVWWTPVAALYTVLHLNAVLKKYLSSEDQEPSPCSGLNTVVTIGLAWIFFAYTPFGTTLLHGQPKDQEKFNKMYRHSVSRETPIEITGYLNKHVPQGLVFNSYEWGDYFLWAGPPEMKIFLNSHAHLVPRDVWLDYLNIASASPNWKDKLDRYGVNTVVVDFRFRTRLINTIKRDEDWDLKYENNLGAVFERKKTILN